MANQLVKGFLVDSGGNALVGAEVSAFDIDVWPFRDRLGSATTNSTGFFMIGYSASAYGPPELAPDILLEVAVNGEVVYSAGEYANVTQTELDIGIITVSGVNYSIRGVVVDTAGNRIAGVMVVARDIDSIGNDFLGSTLTGANGDFVISYPPSQYRDLGEGGGPDIVIVVLDSTGTSELMRTSEFTNVTGSVLNVTLVVPAQLSGGWAITLGADSPPQLTAGNNIEFLVDNQLTFRRIVEAIDNASASVSLMELSYDPTLIATFTGGNIPDSQTTAQRTLAQSLLAADARGVAVRIFVSTFITENPISRSFTNLRNFFAQSPPNNVRVRGINLQQAVHAKGLFVDEENPANAKAFLLGSPLEQGYWDTQLHLQDDLRRGPGATGIKRPPWPARTSDFGRRKSLPPALEFPLGLGVQWCRQGQPASPHSLSCRQPVIAGHALDPEVARVAGGRGGGVRVLCPRHVESDRLPVHREPVPFEQGIHGYAGQGAAGPAFAAGHPADQRTPGYSDLSKLAEQAIGNARGAERAGRRIQLVERDAIERRASDQELLHP